MEALVLHELNIVVPSGTEISILDENIHVRGLSTFSEPKRIFSIANARLFSVL